MAAARRAQARGDAGWWRAREAALLAVGACSEQLLAMRGAGFDLPALLHGVLAEDLQAPHAPAFLVGRALWLSARRAPPAVLSAWGRLQAAARPASCNQLYVFTDLCFCFAPSLRASPLAIPGCPPTPRETRMGGSRRGQGQARRPRLRLRRLAPMLRGAPSAPFLAATVAGLAPTQPASVQVGACRALAALCPGAGPAALQPHLALAYQGAPAHHGCTAEALPASPSA